MNEGAPEAVALLPLIEGDQAAAQLILAEFSLGDLLELIHALAELTELASVIAKDWVES